MREFFFQDFESGTYMIALVKEGWCDPNVGQITTFDIFQIVSSI